jgi:two-component system cell cycle response regulator
VHDQRRELFAMATTDKLTGCHNRHSLMEFSHKFIAQAQRHQYPVSLMVIDLDHFKSINDTHGHAVGDIVLEAIGKLLNSNFREGDLVARFGGEEFVILLNHCASNDARLIAEKTREKMEALKPHDLVVTPSIGLTSLDIGENGSFETMFSIADESVYVAKENGRNQVVFKKPQA